MAKNRKNNPCLPWVRGQYALFWGYFAVITLFYGYFAVEKLGFAVAVCSKKSVLCIG